MAHHPPRQKLVVSGVQVILAKPVVVCEAMQEFWVLENDGPIGGRTSGKAGETAVDVCRGRDLNVSNTETHSGQNLPDRHPIPN